MKMFISSKPSEYLVISKNGRTINCGTSAKMLSWGLEYVLVPSTKHQSNFEMSHEAKDGISLTFKGIIIYRVTQPEVAATFFDFSSTQGHKQIDSMLADICKGELRSKVSLLTMTECIEQRKTTLTSMLATILTQLVEKDDKGHGGWGLSIDIVQVAQVFVSDRQLKNQLETEARNEIKLQSTRSNIHTQEEIKIEEFKSDFKMQQEQAKLQQDQLDLLRNEIEFHELSNVAKKTRLDGELIQTRLDLEVERERAQINQLPTVAETLSTIFENANLSIYGSDSPFIQASVPLFDTLGRSIKEAVKSLEQKPNNESK